MEKEKKSLFWKTMEGVFSKFEAEEAELAEKLKKVRSNKRYCSRVLKNLKRKAEREELKND